jgi:glycosyltransferase involved in cell wall biosynthesis
LTEFPLVSIIIPVFKVEKYIGPCISSLVKQDYPNLELIIVDDGSPDNSTSVAEEILGSTGWCYPIDKINNSDFNSQKIS